jgi:hypothetical protein
MYRKMSKATTDNNKKRKSVPLTREELKSLREYRNGFDSEVACALSLGVDRLVLNRVMLVGSGSQDYIKKIRRKISRLKDNTEPAPVQVLTKKHV